MSKSPQKLNGRNYKLYNGNSECKVVTIESLDNPYVVPLIMNCQEDNPAMISKAVPIGYQDNGTFVLDIDALQHRKDLYSDENGSWAMTGCKAKFYTIIRDEEGKVTELEKVNTQTSSDVVVKRRTYTCSSYTSYHKTIVSIEFGKDIEKWFPLVLLNYNFDGKPSKFTVQKHGNRTSSNMPHIRSKESTKRKVAEKAREFGPKRALYFARKEAGGICEVDSISSIPRNLKQVEYLTRKPSVKKDPLASVLELQKTTFPGFIREVVCNDLPTVMLFTDQQLDNIVKFCCHERVNQVSELGVDVTFQLGPFYVLVTSFKNTVLRVKGANNHPSFLGPVMICMTRDESTYLSFIHCLIREKPGLSEFLHATGTDDERALTNALAAGFRNAAPLLCYIHSQRNIKEKCRKLGLSSSLVSRICQDLFQPRRGLIWSSSLEEFDRKSTLLMSDWDTLERSEKSGPSAFTQYFRDHKLDDMRSKMAAFVVKDLGLGDKPYEQNIPESVNDMLKDWMKYIPQEMDRLIVNLYDFVQSFDQEEEMAWFQLSDKWEVSQQFKCHLPSKGHADMSLEERKAYIKKVRKLCPDPEAYKKCCNFKVQPLCSSTPRPSSRKSASDLSDLSALSGHFSREEQSSLLEKAKTVLNNDQFRQGFKDSVYFVDSGGQLPHRVQCFKSGKCTCDCSFFGRNNLCHHCVAIAIHLNCVANFVGAYQGRSLHKISAASAPKNVGGKAPSRKRPLSATEVEVHHSTDADADVQDTGTNFQSEVVNPTTLVLRRAQRPVDPPPSGPLVLKKIAGNIRKCAGCSKAIKSHVVGYQSEDDQLYCFARFERYHFFNKTTNAWQLTTSTRHYHLNPVCTKTSSTITSDSSLIETGSLRQLVLDRFRVNLD